MHEPRTLSNRLAELLRREHHALADFLVALAETEAVLEAALDLLLAKRDKQKGLVKKPRTAPSRPSASPRHIPAEVKRAAFTRDGGRCQWPMASGDAWMDRFASNTGDEAPA